jgi:hypothetical protein
MSTDDINETFESRDAIQNHGFHAFDALREIIHEKNLGVSFYPKLNEFIREFIEDNKLVSE